jgi:hypothetical protein
MSIFIPQKENKRYSVNLSTDLFGNISHARNLDFTRPGYLSLARKPYVLYTETEDADFETPLAILSDDDDYYVVTSEDTFTIDATTSDVSVVKETTGTPPSNGFQSDGCFFNGELHVSGGTSVNSLGSGTWASDITGLSSSYPHPLCVSEHQQYLAVGNGNTVRLYSTAYSLITTLTIPSDHVVTWIRWRANLLWCGTRNIQGGEAKVFLWNGSGTAAQAGYGVGSEWAFSGCVYDVESTIAVVSASGQLLKFGGSGFIPMRDDAGNEMNFPVYYLGVPWGSSAATSNLRGKVTSRGMEAKGRRIYMVVSGEIDFTNGGTPDYIPNFPSGLWIYDPKVGLYHRAGADHKKHAVVTFSSLASDTLTMSAAQVYETGDPVQVITQGSLTGDIDEIIYYAIKVSSTQIKLALTPQQALAGTNITITGSVTSAEMVMNVYQSVGAPFIAGPGGLCVVKAAGIARFTGSEVVYSADVRLPASSTVVGCVMSLGMGKNVGNFVTSKIQAGAVKDAFATFVSKFGDLNIATRKIIVKYRTKNRWGLPGRRDMLASNLATWVNSTSFTINPKNYDVYSVQIGDEVEFLDGGAAGYTAHISNIVVDSATQWTFTIDEAMPDVAASDTSKPLFQNWTKFLVISTVDDAVAAYEGLKKAGLDGDDIDAKNKAKWIELKFELRGYTDIEETMDFEEVMLGNTPDQNYTSG